MSWANGLVAVALPLTGILAVVAGTARGAEAAVASVCGSWLALLAQLAAVGLLRPAMGAATPRFVRRWAAGMAVRGASVLVLAGLIVTLRGTLPGIWMAAGYLGVLLPLLFLETRFLR